MSETQASETLKPGTHGMSPLILTVLNRDYRTPYYHPYEGLSV